MLFLLALSAGAVQPPPVRIAQARASVRIERPAEAGRDQWRQAPVSVRSERVVRDEQGRLLLLRLVELP